MEYLEDIEVEEELVEPIDIVANRIVSELIDPTVEYELSKEQIVALKDSVRVIINEELE